jgi:hypothetical protein
VPPLSTAWRRAAPRTVTPPAPGADVAHAGGAASRGFARLRVASCLVDERGRLVDVADGRRREVDDGHAALHDPRLAVRLLGPAVLRHLVPARLETIRLPSKQLDEKWDRVDRRPTELIGNWMRNGTELIGAPGAPPF